ncbi:MAG: diacylglycerol/lipid kinase family protein [Acidimicrobiales bacterium]
MGTFVIGNPAAGRGQVGRQWEDLLALLAGHGLDPEGRLTAARGHAVELARHARRDGWDLVVAAGGDGTLHEVVNGLLAEPAGGAPPVLGMVPAGSGCDYARCFDVPAGLGAVARLVSATPPRPVDVGVVRCRREGADHDRHFLNIAEVGIGAEVARRAARLPRALGTAVYLAAFWPALARHTPHHARIRPGGHPERAGALRDYEGPLTNLVVAIGSHFGGGMQVAPGADPSDGLFDVQVQFGSKLDYTLALPRVFRGTHLPHPRVREERAVALEVECRPPAMVEADGEFLGTTPASFVLHPGALYLKV